ncbi:g8972 [Coccomyxa elongata]
MLEAAFTEWLHEGGANIYGVEAAAVPEGYRGVVAISDIEPGSILVRVPERLLVSAHSAKKEKVFAEASSANPPIPSSQVLAAHLLHEVSKGSQSFWGPYFASLPRQYTCLSYFTTEDAQELQVAYAVEVAKSVAEALRSDYTSVKPLLNALGLPAKFKTLGAWRWAAATVASRTMHLPDDAAGALMPFGDLHNHRSPPAATQPDLGILAQGQPTIDSLDSTDSSGTGRFDTELREYQLYAQTRYWPGEQVFLSYGAHTNLELLEHYGFVLEDNPYDTAQLPIEMLPEDIRGTVPVKASCLQRNGMPSWELLRELRIWAASKTGCIQKKYLAAQGKPVSKVSEACAFKTVLAVCQDILCQLPTTYAEDKEMLQTQGNSGECQHLAILWRINYKRILQNGVELACQVIETSTVP